MTLHVLSVSPWSGSAFAQCLGVLRPGDAVLLIGDGVNAMLAGSEPAHALDALEPSVRVHALTEDCTLRGVQVLRSRVQGIDYAGFVALACEHERSVSWF